MPRVNLHLQFTCLLYLFTWCLYTYSKTCHSDYIHIKILKSPIIKTTVLRSLCLILNIWHFRQKIKYMYLLVLSKRITWITMIIINNEVTLERVKHIIHVVVSVFFISDVNFLIFIKVFITNKITLFWEDLWSWGSFFHGKL